MEILSFGIRAPGLDPGVGEMFQFVGPTAGNRALFLRIALPPSQICKEFPWACDTGLEVRALGASQSADP